MGTKYSTVSVSGYNATPPADDGTQVSANKVTWAKHKTKLGDPLKTAIEAIDTALVAHFNEGPSAKTTTYTTVAGDHNKTIQCNGTFTVSLLDAATATAGYTVTLKNAGSGTITVDTDTSGDQIDGEASVTLGAKESITCVVNSTANGYYRKAGYNHVITTRGDVIYGNSSGVAARLALGSAGKVLQSDGTDVAWTDAAASQAQQEAASSTTVFVTPGRQKYHPGTSKAWVKFDGTGTITVRASYNVDTGGTPLVDNGTGDYTVNWDVDFSSAHYACVVTVEAETTPTNNRSGYIRGGGQAAGSVRIETEDGSGNRDLPGVHIVAFGDQ